jgi:hypothetical protein
MVAFLGWQAAKVLWGAWEGAGTARPHPFSIFAIFVFRVAYAECRFSKAAEMQRVDLVETTMQAWARLDAEQRDRFFKAGLKAAVRLDRLEFRAWLLRRLRNPPLSRPADPAAFTISDADMALLLNQTPLRTTRPSRCSSPTSRNTAI